MGENHFAKHPLDVKTIWSIIIYYCVYLRSDTIDVHAVNIGVKIVLLRKQNLNTCCRSNGEWSIIIHECDSLAPPSGRPDPLTHPRPTARSLWPWVPHPPVDIYSSAQPSSTETQFAHEELFVGLIGHRGTSAKATDGKQWQRQWWRWQR